MTRSAARAASMLSSKPMLRMLPAADARPVPSGFGADVRRRIKDLFGPTAVLVLLVAVLWLATHPYEGLTGDARFYMVQVLHALDPTRFTDDIYFRYGSQDQFTIFTSLYAPLVKLLGVGPGGMAMTVCGQLLWISGLVYLAKGLIPDRHHALLAVSAAIALPGTYAMFDYGEAFVTPRLFAEAFTLISLALIVRHRTRGALLTITVAAALHPLTALSGIAFLFLYLAIAKPVWWWIGGLGVAVVLVLGQLGVRPFSNLTVTSRSGSDAMSGATDADRAQRRSAPVRDDRNNRGYRRHQRYPDWGRLRAQRFRHRTAAVARVVVADPDGSSVCRTASRNVVRIGQD
jgi:hypothetical protein